MSQKLMAKLNKVIEYPELEDLEITPSLKQQKFKSEKYGYNEVTVNAIECEALNIKPSSEEQVKEGLFNRVTVEGESNLVSENIKKDVSIFGVIGSYAGVKQFATIEEITNASANEEGELAIVYGEKISAMTSDAQVQTIMFPETVVLPQAITNDVSARFRAVDSSTGYFDGYANLSDASFNFEGYTENGELSVRYQSTDGITYTRTTTEEIIDCGTLIYPRSWDDNFGYFMQNKVKKFDGLFEFRKNVPDENYRRFFTGIKYNSELNVIESRYTENVYAVDIITHIYNAVLQNYETKGIRDFICKFYDIVDGKPTKCRMFYAPYSYLAVAKYPEYENAILLLGVAVTTKSKNSQYFDINLITGEATEITTISRSPNAIGSSGYAYFYLEDVEEDAYYAIARTNTSDNSTWQIAFESYEFRTYINTYSSKSVGRVTYGLFDKFVQVN